MTLDWGRLAAAIAEARRARGWNQENLAKAAGVGRSTVQNLEGAGGYQYKRLPSSSAQIERALGWPEGTMAAILNGGEAPAPQEAEVPAPAESGARERPAFARGMPLRIAHELSTGDVVDTVVLDLSREGQKVTLVGVLKTDDAASIDDPEAYSEALDRWVQAQRKMRGLPTSEPED
jgi:transcriptional regulator with XRE-family HTH domain